MASLLALAGNSLMMRTGCAQLGLRFEPVRFEGASFGVPADTLALVSGEGGVSSETLSDGGHSVVVVERVES
ncbi:MAG: uncharacterized protein KVP18_003155 [Porospora cf. gigantea A]|uniref:uncharacterized protein n=1 Tax=Porospora cf. gigantea A TaxID=2853593 RepID=UPI00355A6358|nr:MAG: hypothetical protein KVP18_003155 [Porospora cf. gigantea A]